MTREEFERLRDRTPKTIRSDLRFAAKVAGSSLLLIEDVSIENDAGVDLRLNGRFHAETGATTFNVHVPGTGPICRLCVGTVSHEDAGPSHKHALADERSPRLNLARGVVPRPELAGRSVREIFGAFCEMSGVVLIGRLHAPDEGPETGHA